MNLEQQGQLKKKIRWIIKNMHNMSGHKDDVQCDLILTFECHYPENSLLFCDANLVALPQWPMLSANL